MEEPIPNPVPRRRDEGIVERAVAFSIDLVRFVVYAALRFWHDRCFGAASSLSYTSLLAVVPVVAIGFAILAAFPVFDKIRADLLQFMLSNFLPSNVEAVRSFLDTFLKNTRELTAVGIVALAVTAIILLDTIDTVFNLIWRQKQARPLHQRLIMYWAILTVTPLLLGGSLAVTTIVIAKTRLAADGGFVSFWLQALPVIFLFAAIALSYLIVPYRRVRIWHAAVGAAVVVAAFQTLRWGFQLYFRMFPSYETLYGALALIPLSLVWMYLVWCIVLLGAQISASIPEWTARRLMGQAPPPMVRLARALEVLERVLAAHRAGTEVRDEDLAGRLATAAESAGPVVGALEAAGLIVRTEKDAWLLGRDLSQVTLDDLFRVLEMKIEHNLPPDALEAGWSGALEKLLARYEAAGSEVLSADLETLLLAS